ncbi:MAG: choice-of-anchor tandem repeat GloVer-containing protein, partial [Tepidisphaeraceae bacterium]
MARSFGRSTAPSARLARAAVFSVEPLERRCLLTATPTTLFAFNSAVVAQGVVADNSGDLFGTTEAGGDHDSGTIWELASGSTVPTALYSFTGASDGSSPVAITIDSAGNLYGTTLNGAAETFGTIWELPKGATTVTNLYTFTTKAQASGIAIDSNGDLFGTTQFQGTDGIGSIWELAAGATAPTTLYSFTNSTDGEYPQGIAIDSAGNLYGACADSSIGSGTLWKLPVGATAVTTLYAFPGGADVAYPDGVAIDAEGNLFGTDSYTGADNNGTAWEFAAGATAVTTLYSFTDGNDGAVPGEVCLDHDGDFFGTTLTGGSAGNGTIFEFAGITTPELTLTTPASAVSVNVGDSYTIDWTGGSPTDSVQLWAEGGPNNAWLELTPGVAQSAGSYTWNTTGIAHGWYYFQAWDIPTSASSYAVQSPNYLHIVDSAAAAPTVSISNPVLAGEAIAQGGNYTVNFTAGDGAGDTNSVYVQLWVYSGNTGQWTVLPSANYLPASQGYYVWQTTGVAPGWYSFAAHATNGDDWSYASSPGWLNITVPTPAIAITTPTSGQSVAAGGT